MKLTDRSWSRAWKGLSATSDGVNVRDALLARYAEPHRKYHTLQHLGECLALFDSHEAPSERAAEIEMALWFHDAIYDLQTTTNEDLSAAWAEKELLAANVSKESAKLVSDLVLVTKHTGLPATPAEKLLVDIDLSILGATPERFAQYEQQIRQEYAYVPSPLFETKRKEILQSFVDRAAIYNTMLMFERFEQQARRNLSSSLLGAKHG